MGQFGYIPFILVFLKFENASYDMRQSVHKLMGVTSFAFILVNWLTFGGYWYMDLFLFSFAGYYFYRAMSENFDRVSHAALITMAAFGIATLGAVWVNSRPTTKPGAKPGEKTAEEKQMEQMAKQAMDQLKNLQRPPSVEP